ncbi:MAG: S8 family peptidase [Gaiellaceae bacterium]
MKWSLVTAAALVVLVLVAASGSPPPSARQVRSLSEVVVTLTRPPLAQAPSAAGRGPTRLRITAPASRRYLRELDAGQSAVARRILDAIPGAAVRWRYRIVLDGLAVVIPTTEVAALRHVPGVRDVFPSVRFHSLGGSVVPSPRPLRAIGPRGREQGQSAADTVSQTGAAIGAPALWGSDLATAGQGVKIGIIDDGVDQSHLFFDPAGYEMPPGFPKGNSAYTTAKVIVARAFPPPSTSYANADLPFDPRLSSHATHVAGIAAGNYQTEAAMEGSADLISGIAPKAYIGNYKALTVPTPEFGLDGNSPEIVRAIEAAVADGMDVINLSLGEPEIEPSRDIVTRALDGASKAGVVVAVAAGNEFGEFGEGSIDSPGSAPRVITAAAEDVSSGKRVDRLASFSSGGPTGLALLLKPDVSAPGVNVVSSVPSSDGTWASISGTSMATPHVAGAAALLRQRHPGWSAIQIKSAFELTGVPVRDASGREVSPLRQGGGGLDLPAADQPQLFTSPTSLSFGFLHRGQRLERRVALTDAGGGTGDWRASLSFSQTVRGVRLSLPDSAAVPGSLALSATAAHTAREGDVSGFIVLSRAGVQRRIPFWLRLTVPRLGLDSWSSLRQPGTYDGDTRGRAAHVSRYLYPQHFGNMPRLLSGPEEVFRFRLRRPVANFGVVVLSSSTNVAVTPRIVRGGDENRVQGMSALPLDINPYRSTFDQEIPAAAVVRPAPGLYQIVFDSVDASGAGRFRFHFWVDDRSPPRLRLLSVRQRVARVAAVDRGSGVDPASLSASVDGRPTRLEFDSAHGIATVQLSSFPPGRHKLVLQAADYQEAKNMENTGPILSNTAQLSAGVVLH